MTPPQDDCIITYRGGIVECRHQIHAAIVDSTGRLLYVVGNASRLTLIRSAAKPVQALAIVETGCLEHYNFDECDLALICASHNADEDKHISRARSMLDRIGAKESNLRCGGHPSINQRINTLWIKKDFEPTGLYNNCSGKHAGMLAGAQKIGAGFEDYHLPNQPMQIRVKQAVEDLCKAEAEAVKWGIDGCNLPAPAMPLHLLAKTYATFASAADISSKTEEVPTRTRACSRIFHAMTQHPELVAGDGRFCTDLMTAFKGDLIGKVGAEGCYGVGIRESEFTRRLGAVGAMGIGVKVEDGNINILYSAVVEILDQLAIGTAEVRQRVAAYKQKEVLNTAGVVAGHVEHAFLVRPVAK